MCCHIDYIHATCNYTHLSHILTFLLDLFCFASLCRCLEERLSFRNTDEQQKGGHGDLLSLPSAPQRAQRAEAARHPLRRLCHRGWKDLQGPQEHPPGLLTLLQDSLLPGEGLLHLGELVRWGLACLPVQHLFTCLPVSTG